MSKQKTALITGAASGIGLAISQHLAKQGYKVWVSDVNLESAQKVAIQIKGQALALDVTQQEHIDAAVASIELADGRLDVLVNNAGIQHVAPLEDFPVDKWRLVNDVLLVGPAMLTRGFLPMMRSNNYGRIVNISSINAQKGQFGQSNYSAAKAGIHGFTKALAQEVAAKGVTVNTVSPGYVMTPMVAKIAPEVLAKIAAGIPVGRLGEPEEIGKAVAYLASKDCGYVTGSDFSINGGQHMS